MNEFVELFGRYVQGGAQDEGLYVQVTQRSVRMQRELGRHGVMAMFRPPFANFAYQNYQILLNMLPEYRQSANDFALRSQASQYASAIRDALVRYSGSLDELEREVGAELKNPFIWLKEGVTAVVASPFKLLGSMGLLSPRVESGITSSTVVRIASGILALVTLVAGLVQIVTGWEATLSFIHRLAGR